MTKEALKILCVDDEPDILEGLELSLSRKYGFFSATSGPEGLKILEQHPDLAVVLSDMRMPKMNGAQFLAEVRQRAPDATRMLLTGQTDIDAAVAAINDGQIFRFLSKPCPRSQLKAAFKAATEQHRLVISERQLLEQTVRGSIRALVNVLSMTHPVAFGRATRLQRIAKNLCADLGIETAWPIEVAAMVCQLGCVTWPDELSQKVTHGDPLTRDEEALLKKLPEHSERVLAHIPRLEPVLDILRAWGSGKIPDNRAVGEGVSILRLAIDYDGLIESGSSPVDAAAALESRNNEYGSAALKALIERQVEGKVRQEQREIPLMEVEEGMVFADNVRDVKGLLLVARGFEATAGCLARLRGFDPARLPETVRVFVPSELC